MEHINDNQNMKKHKPPIKPEFTIQELLELWNNCPDEAICTKIADYVQEQQIYVSKKIEK